MCIFDMGLAEGSDKLSLLIYVCILTVCIHLCIAVYEVALHKDEMKVLEQKKVLPLGYHIRSYFHSFLKIKGKIKFLDIPIIFLLFQRL